MSAEKIATARKLAIATAAVKIVEIVSAIRRR
jgi:hypothetical protein